MTSTTENKDSLEKIQQHMTEYNTILGDMEIIYNEYKEEYDDLFVKYYERQINNICKLSKELENSGHPLEKICAKISRDVEKYDIDSRRVREVLDDRYKQSKHDKTLPSKRGGSTSYDVVTNSAQNDKKPELDLETEEIHKPLLFLNNDGSTTAAVLEDKEGDRKDEHDDSEDNKKESIDLNQLRRIANREVREDREETLDSSGSNSIFASTASLLPQQLANSDKTKILNKLRQKDLQIQKLESEVERLTEDWQFEVDRNRKQLSERIKVSDPVILQENADLKKEVQGLRTKLEEIDKEVIKQNDPLLQGYKDLEIAKLDAQRVTWLLKTSQQSQKTLFILINPKTDEIIHVKTDIDYHRIMARRQQVQVEERKEEEEEEVSAS